MLLGKIIHQIMVFPLLFSSYSPYLCTIKKLIAAPSSLFYQENKKKCSNNPLKRKSL